MEFSMTAEKFVKAAQDADIKIIAELSNSRFVARVPLERLATGEVNVRFETPDQKHIDKMADNTKNLGILYAPLVVAAEGEKGLKFVVIDGIQRVRTAQKNKETSLEATIYTGITQQKAIDIAASANGWRFEQDDTDLLEIMKTVKDEKLVMAITRRSEKTIGRYAAILKAGLDRYIITEKKKDNMFPVNFALKVITACGADVSKTEKLLHAIENQKHHAICEIQKLKEKQQKTSKKVNEKEMKFKFYFPSALLENWVANLLVDEELVIGEAPDLYDEFNVTSDPEVWDKGIPKVGIEGRKWGDFTTDQLDQALTLLDVIKQEIHVRKNTLQSREKLAKMTSKKGIPIGLDESKGKVAELLGKLRPVKDEDIKDEDIKDEDQDLPTPTK